MTEIVLDQTGDINGQELYRISRTYALPPFVKEASSNDVVGAEQMEQHLYASPRGKYYPCHTAAATYVSTLFFLDKRANWDAYSAKAIEKRLDDFAEYHGISERMHQLKQAFTKSGQAPEVTLTDDDYALVLDGERHYPLRNGQEVKAAAVWLQKYHKELPFTLRQPMAERMLQKAAQFGAGLGDGLDDFLEKQAGHGACDSPSVARFLFERSVLYKQAGYLDYAIKVAEMAKTVAKISASHDSDALVKLAGLIDQCDRETHIEGKFPALTPPEDVFFIITEKAASAMLAQHVHTMSGNIYKRADFNSASLDGIRDVMGEDFAEAISAGGLYVSEEKLAEVLPTLPRGDAELFDQLLQSMGIFPVAKEAATKSGGFNNEELLVLAGAHKPLLR